MAIMKNGDTYTWGSNENYKLATDQENYRVFYKKNKITLKKELHYTNSRNQHFPITRI